MFVAFPPGLSQMFVTNQEQARKRVFCSLTPILAVRKRKDFQQYLHGAKENALFKKLSLPTHFLSYKVSQFGCSEIGGTKNQ